MNRFVPAVVIVLALVVAFFLSRPKASNEPQALSTTVKARVLEGTANSPQAVENLRVVLVADGLALADSAVTAGRYRLELPSQIISTLESLKDVQLVHGDGRLPENVLGTDTKILMYDDQNKSGALDSGEPQLEAALFPPKTDPNLRTFFKYKVLLLGSASRFIETQDTATGTKGYYRYNLPLQSGWNILEGELASNGYDVRLRPENSWDIFAALPAGGKATPPAFTPQ